MIRLFSVVLIGSFAMGTASAFAISKKKLTYEMAKKECLKEEPELKGRSLKKCITKKRK